MRDRCCVAGFFVVVLLTACGGGGGSMPAPAASVSAPSAAPLASPSPFAGGGTLAVTFTSNVPAAARSVKFTFTTAGGSPQSVSLALANGCSQPCALSVSAPVGVDLAVQTLLYATANASGSALAVGSGTATVLAGSSTAFAVPLTGIMASFTAGLSPATVTVGQEATIQVTEHAFDAAGEALAPGFVNASLAAPAFTSSISDATGYSTVSTYSGASTYSGFGAGPITYTVQSAGYASAKASLAFSAAPPFTPAYAINAQGFDTNVGGCVLAVYAAGSTTPGRQYSVPCTNVNGRHPAPVFDKNGTIWGVASVGITPSGTSAGPLGVSGMPLAFDRSGNAYTADPATTAVDQYLGTTLTRQIVVASAPIGVAVDPSGDVYVGIAGSLAEYPPTGTGAIAPLTSNTSAGYAAIDEAGNVYASYMNATLGVWSAGTFGPGAPSFSYSIAQPNFYSLSAYAVNAGGGLATLLNTATLGLSNAGYAPPGSTTISPVSGVTVGTGLFGTIGAPLQ